MKIYELDEPENIKDAIGILDIIFEETGKNNKDEIDYFNNSKTSDIMYEYHHSLGTTIRNAWLWPKNPNQISNIYKLFFNRGIRHPDDMSGFLLRLFWYYKHEQKISLEKHIERMFNEIIIKDILE